VNATEALKKLRKQIDRADREILRALAERSRIVQEIAKAKAELGLPVIHAARRAEVQKERTRQGQKLGLNPKFVDKIFRLIQAESVQCQRVIIRKIKIKRSRSSKGKS
jgi:chorismate mutase